MSTSKADAALKKLIRGNNRFVSGTSRQNFVDNEKRLELAKGQNPFAVIVGCSDSRVPPELIFDRGHGDLFIVRTAGHVIGKTDLGSIEYAVENLGTPLIFVLGHEQCGAVKATLWILETQEKLNRNIGSIIRKIMPAAEAAQKRGGTKETVLKNAIRENISKTVKDILLKSKVIKSFHDKGTICIQAGEYSLRTGKVELF